MRDSAPYLNYLLKKEVLPVEEYSAKRSSPAR